MTHGVDLSVSRAVVDLRPALGVDLVRPTLNGLLEDETLPLLFQALPYTGPPNRRTRPKP